MTFKNKKHAERFIEATTNMKNADFADSSLLASIYLLTCYKRVWKRFENSLDRKNGIKPEAFDGFEPKSETENALVTAAYDLLYCADCINLTDLTDKETVPNDAFAAICHAISYVRYGL